MSLGLRDAGFELCAAFDYDAFAVQTYRKNIGEHGFEADARRLSGNDLIVRAGVRMGELDLFAGGPPCQGFSKQKRGAHLGDTRNDLVLEYARIVGELQPRMFLLENVATLGGKRGEGFVAGLSRRLPNYKLHVRYFNSADFGVPQTRKRFILVGRRLDVDAAYSFPHPLSRSRVTVGDVLSDLPEPPADYTDHPDFVNHQRARVTPLNIFRFSFVRQGGGWQDIPEEHRLPCHRGVDTSKGGWPDVYGRLRWDGQCPTITGGFDSFTRGRYGHPLHDRPLTPREAARIQGFPDSFHFLGTRADVRSQIGNAVPPPMARCIGESIQRCLRVADGHVIGRRSSEEEAGELEQIALL
jgi:DNA (cytosine-5)-methyltransferase 1